MNPLHWFLNFLCFSKEDVPWLVETLWKKRGKGTRNLDIEVDHGFKLFIHPRDFVAGKTIISNIQHGIEKAEELYSFYPSKSFFLKKQCKFSWKKCISDKQGTTMRGIS